MERIHIESVPSSVEDGRKLLGWAKVVASENHSHLPRFEQYLEASNSSDMTERQTLLAHVSRFMGFLCIGLI